MKCDRSWQIDILDQATCLAAHAYHILMLNQHLKTLHRYIIPTIHQSMDAMAPMEMTAILKKRCIIRLSLLDEYENNRSECHISDLDTSTNRYTKRTLVCVEPGLAADRTNVITQNHNNKQQENTLNKSTALKICILITLSEQNK